MQRATTALEAAGLVKKKSVEGVARFADLDGDEVASVAGTAVDDLRIQLMVCVQVVRDAESEGEFGTSIGERGY